MRFVPLSSVDPLVGYVVVDDLIQLYRDELSAALGRCRLRRCSPLALRIASPCREAGAGPRCSCAGEQRSASDIDDAESGGQGA